MGYSVDALQRPQGTNLRMGRGLRDRQYRRHASVAAFEHRLTLVAIALREARCDFGTEPGIVVRRLEETVVVPREAGPLQQTLAELPFDRANRDKTLSRHL